ncbi:MAG: WGR domain-containing protein [Cypionkella sp.]
MLTFLLTTNGRPAPRFYRVDVAYNLFGEYSVIREWGEKGRRGTHLLVWFANLREACIAAEHWRKQAIRRGYTAKGMIT